MKQYVLDTSFAIAWVVESERTPELLRHYEALHQSRTGAVVPALWPDEMAKVFLTLERKGSLTAEQIFLWSDAFAKLPIEVRPPSIGESLHEVRLLGQTHKLSAYDARYLHLALELGVPLATLDAKLRSAAASVGVKLVRA